MTDQTDSVRSLPRETLRKFMVATESVSFSDAAEVLGITKQAVTKAVRAVEQSCGGMVLFDRSAGHEAQPTSVALQVAKHCHRLLEDYSALEVALTNVRVRRTPIRLGCFPVHLERAVFPAQLALGIDDQLEVDFSRVRQNRARGVGRTLAEELRSGIVDITFGPLLPGMEEFAAKPLYSATIRAVSPSITTDISTSALDGKPLCMAPRGFASRRKIQTAFDEARITPLVVFENLLPSTLIRAAEAGFGTALVPDDYAEVRTLNAPALIEVNGEPLATEVFAFWRRNEDMPSLKRLIDAMPTENS